MRALRRRRRYPALATGSAVSAERERLLYQLVSHRTTARLDGVRLRARIEEAFPTRIWMFGTSVSGCEAVHTVPGPDSVTVVVNLVSFPVLSQIKPQAPWARAGAAFAAPSWTLS